MNYNVVGVEPLDGYKIRVSFRDGKVGVFDMTRYLERPLWRPLASRAIFCRCVPEDGTVVWPGDIDIAPEVLYDGVVTG